jgi:hexosaminidase
LVAYAQSRFIMIVPEIDMPGHTNAALASYAELNCNGIAPALYTGTRVGFSSLCASKDITYAFVSDVVREIAALTPSPYFHIGGDESSATSPADYKLFVNKVAAIVKSYGKQVVGWDEIAESNLPSDSIVQTWNISQGNKFDPATLQPGIKVVLSPADKTYMDMKYDPSTTLGLNWAGYIEVDKAYNWDPAREYPGLAESDILGVEAALWSETLRTLDDIEFMAFPRILGFAEMGWSAQAARSWDEYKMRLGKHGARLTALGVKFYKSPVVPWQP